MASPDLRAQAPDLGDAHGYGLLAGEHIATVNSLPVAGRVGAAQTVAPPVSASGGVYAYGSGNVNAALDHAQQARDWCHDLSGQTSLGSLNGQVLPAGHYTLDETTLTDELTLTGDTSSIYIFNVAGNLAVASTAQLDLGQVRPHHVYWNVAGDFEAAAFATWQGVVLTGGAAHFAGNIDGTLAVLAGGAVTFGPRQVRWGSLLVGSVAAQLGKQYGPIPPPCGPNSANCQGVAQQSANLVLNGSFEAGNCAGSNGDFGTYSAAGIDWGKVGCWLRSGSPDIFYGPAGICQIPTQGVPRNFANDVTPAGASSFVGRSARTGDSYAGAFSVGLPSQPQHREYVHQQLPQALTPGRPYYAEYYASLAPTSTRTLQQLQIAFTSNPLPARSQNGMLTSADVNVVVTTTALSNGIGVGWDRVGGVFTPPANSNYRTMVLGNFEPNGMNTSVSGRGPAYRDANTPPQYPAAFAASIVPPLNDDAYYYIDDVLLVPFPSAGPVASTGGGPGTGPSTVHVPCGGTAQLGGCPLPASAGATYIWSPAAGLSNPNIANPVFNAATAPGPSTTYRLFVYTNISAIIDSTSVTVIVNNGQSCIPPACQHSYVANPDATYDPSFQTPAAASATVLGETDPAKWPSPKQPPIIRGNGPNGPPVVFDGIYHVVSPVEFQDGVFDVRPGTVFYVDGGPNWALDIYGPCYSIGDPLRNRLKIRIGEDARVKVTGGTFTTTCDEQWGGIELLANAELATYADKSRRSEISHASVGVLLGTPCQSDDANCLLTGTDFINNYYGAASMGHPSRRDPDRNGVIDCRFTSSPGQMLPPVANLFTETGLVLHGEWHDELEYTKNTFHSLNRGVELSGGTDEMRLHGNGFKDNHRTSIVVGHPGSYYAPGRILVDENNISVPGTPNPGGQVVSSAAVYGIEVGLIPKGGQEVLIEANTIESAVGNSTARYKVGMGMRSSFTSMFTRRQNQFIKLNEGIELADPSASTTKTEHITDNYFYACDRAVSLQGGIYAFFAPTISCNTVEECDLGILVGAGSSVGLLAGPYVGAAALSQSKGYEPAANRFLSNTTGDIENAGRYMVTYFALNSPPEMVNIVPTGNSFNLLRVPGTICKDRPASYGTPVYGLNSRPTAGTSPTAQQVQDWETHLLQETGTDVVLHEESLLLLDYREKSGQFAQLETFTNTLPLASEAFDRFCLYLMEKYRQLGQPADAQRVRTALLNRHGSVAEVQNRVAYYDVADHLMLLAPGQRPAAADSTSLVAVANSASDYAPFACSTLRYFYPQLGCGAATGGLTGSSGAAARQLAATPKAGKLAATLRAYPNPATETVTVQVSDLTHAATRFELVEMSTGRVVLTRTDVANGPQEVRVGSLAPGVYVGRLLGEAGQVLGTTKIVIIH